MGGRQLEQKPREGMTGNKCITLCRVRAFGLR